MVRNLPANTRDERYADSIPRLGKIPWRRKWQPIPVFLPEKSQRQRSLAGHSPWGHKESDTTERVSRHTCILFYISFFFAFFFFCCIACTILGP